MDIELQGKHFLSLKEFDLKSGDGEQMTLLMGPNKSGKTQLLKLVYSAMTWGHFDLNEISKDMQEQKEKFGKFQFPKELFRFEYIFLEDNLDKILREFGSIIIKVNAEEVLIKREQGHNYINGMMKTKYSPTFIYTAAWGDYYWVVFEIDKSFPYETIFPATLTDFVKNLFGIIGIYQESRFKEELQFLNENLDVDFSVETNGVYFSEGANKYNIEKAASGLKSFAPLYLALRYNIVKDVLIVDEPEASLHPAWITVMAELLYRIAKKGVKVFVATHSDYFIEKINVFLKKDVDFNVAVWKFERDGEFNRAGNAELKNRQVSPRDMLKVYYDTLKEMKNGNP